MPIAPTPTSAFGVNMPWALTPSGLPTAPQPDPFYSPLASRPVAGPAPRPPLPVPTAATLAAPANSGVPAPTTPAAPAPQQSPYAAPAAAGLAGIQAGQVGAQAYDTKSGIASTLGAGVAGGLAGAPGGPLGIAAGAAAGLILGGLNAWMSVGKENKANRDKRQLLAEAKAEQNRRDKIARDDALDGLAYERRQVEEAKRLEEWNRARGLIADARAKSKARKEEYLNRGFVA